MPRGLRWLVAVPFLGGGAAACAPTAPAPTPAVPFEVRRFGDNSPPALSSAKPSKTPKTAATDAPVAEDPTADDENPLVEERPLTPEEAQRALIEEISRGAAAAPEEPGSCADLPEDQRDACDRDVLIRKLDQLGP